MEPTASSEDKEKEQSSGQKKFSRKKETQEEKLAKIDIKKSEQVRLDAVFADFCAYEDEPSSDEDSKEKQYKKLIEERANAKRMKIPKSNFKSKTAEKTEKKKKKKTEDEEDQDEDKKKKKEKKKGFSFKAIRKTLRNLCNEYAKDDVTQMIWEVDENQDGKVSEEEFTNMYKKCVTDEKEEEGKKLFYLVQFLMYDVEKKHYITEEDTLEILCARNEAGMDATIDAIFGENQKQPDGNVKRVKKDKLNYIEYEKKMHQLSMGKRKEIANKKKDFCKKVQEKILNKENI